MEKSFHYPVESGWPLESNGVVMQNEIENSASPGMEFLPLLEEKLRRLLDDQDRICKAIDKTRKTIEELQVKLTGSELPLPAREKVEKRKRKREKPAKTGARRG